MLDAAASLPVVEDALRVGPVLEALLERSGLRVLGGHEVVSDHDDLSASKTFCAPIFSICRNATGPETSFAMTGPQRTIKISPGETSSASVWESSIFSASVRGIG